MAASKIKPVAPRARNAAASRSCILEHAVAEFATQGVAGARTAAIAEAAGSQQGPALLLFQGQGKSLLGVAAGGFQRAGRGCAAVAGKPALARGKNPSLCPGAFRVSHPSSQLSATDPAGALARGQYGRALQGLSRHQHGALYSSAARRAARLWRKALLRASFARWRERAR